MAEDFDLVTTRGGDRGESGMYSGERLRKDDPVFACLGDLDELNCALGLCRSHLAAEAGQPDWPRLQSLVMAMASAAATSPAHELYRSMRLPLQSDLDWIEAEERHLLAKTRIEPVFVAPGGCELSARLDMARAVARRAERSLVTLIRDRGRSDLHLCQNILNRLSDYLFVAARAADQNSPKPR